jgi:hypothetical protein
VIPIDPHGVGIGITLHLNLEAIVADLITLRQLSNGVFDSIIRGIDG